MFRLWPSMTPFLGDTPPVGGQPAPAATPAAAPSQGSPPPQPTPPPAPPAPPAASAPADQASLRFPGGAGDGGVTTVSRPIYGAGQQVAAAGTGQPPPGLSRDPAVRARLSREIHVYSQNFGILDKHHIGGNFQAYLDVYAAAQRAASTGQAQTVSITHGSGMTRHTMTYRVEPPRGVDAEALHRVARQVAADASYRYEAHTVVAGGAGNMAGEVAGRGTSAFSTEDLPSNGLGLMAAEAYIRRHGSTQAGPDADLEAIDYVLDRAGGLAAQDPTGQVQRTSFGNGSFIPRRASSLPPEPGADAYLRQLDAEFRARGGGTTSGPARAEGDHWRLTETSGTFVGNVVEEHVTRPIDQYFRRLRHSQWNP